MPGSAYAGTTAEDCLVSQVRRQGNAAEVLMRAVATGIYVNGPSDGPYLWESGKWRRQNHTSHQWELHDKPFLLQAGDQATYDFGSHHSGCRLTAFDVDGKLAVKVVQW